jgi:O-succinylbenzoate synthase
MGQTIQQRQLKVLEGIDCTERKRHAEGHHAGTIHLACPVCRGIKQAKQYRICPVCAGDPDSIFSTPCPVCRGVGMVAINA